MENEARSLTTKCQEDSDWLSENIKGKISTMCLPSYFSKLKHNTSIFRFP